MKTHYLKQSFASMILVSLSLYGCGGGGGGNSDSGEISSNTAPVIEGDIPEYVRVGQSYSFAPTASDGDNDVLLFTGENIPDWITLDFNTGELRGSPSVNDVGIYDDVTISVDDGNEVVSTEPFSIKVLNAEVSEENIFFDETAIRTETPEGFNVVGDTSLVVGNMATELRDADLQFEFDEEGNLLDLTGESLLPPVIGDNFSLDASVRAIIGMYTGAEINSSLEIGPDSEPGILLQDEIRYIVYFLETGLDLTFHAGDGEDEEINLGLAGARIYMVSDPTDPFLYYFGDIAGVGLGFGYSHNSLIPWEPLFDASGSLAFEALEPFDGEAVLKGIFPVSAFRVFDVLEYTGVAVCQSPQLFSCNKPSYTGIASALAGTLASGESVDPSQQFKVGINGSVDLRFAILGIDLFTYPLLDASAMMDVGTTRQKLAIQGVIDTQESEQPAWLPFAPVPDLGLLTVANIFADVAVADGQGDFGVSLYGEIDSFFPSARLEGSIDIGPEGLQMVGVIDNPTNPITVSADVDGEGLEASITFGYDIQGNIDALFSDALDRAFEEVDQALEDLDNAIIDYNGAVSLDGLRSQIPTIVDNAISILNGTPDSVYNSVYNGTRSGMNSASYTYVDPIFGTRTTFYVRDYINVNSSARNLANTARNQARDRVNTRIAELENLRTEAERTEDTPAFRSALKSLLEQVARNDRFQYSYTASQTIDFGVTRRTFTFYSFSTNQTIITAAQKTTLETAASNVDNIGPADTIRINTQEYYDSLPLEDAIEGVRSDVESGLQTIPAFRGAGYRVGRDLSQTVYIDMGSERIEVEFNPLEPVTVITDIADLALEQLLP